MKKILSVVMLVCIVASMCTVSAWAADPNPGIDFISVYGTEKTGTFGSPDYRERFSIEIYDSFQYNKSGKNYDFISTKSLEIRLQKDDTILSKTTKNDGKAQNVTTANIVLYGEPSSSWNTTWYLPLSDTYYPNRIVIIVDGDETKPFVYDFNINGGNKQQYNQFVSVDMPVVTMSNGVVVGYYNTLDEAVAAAPAGSKSFISIRANGTYPLSDAQGKDITFISNASNVTIDNDPNGNYSNSTFENIPVTNPPAPVNPPAPPAQNDPAPNNPAPAAPVVENVYYIPATDDNSNMALWSILALALLSTAFVTRKRKNEN